MQREFAQRYIFCVVNVMELEAYRDEESQH